MKPNERDPAVERLMQGLEPPSPPPDLRSKVLAAARARMAGEPATDVWSMIWNNRGIRLAWAAAVVLLVAGHAMVVPGNRKRIQTDRPSSHCGKSRRRLSRRNASSNSDIRQRATDRRALCRLPVA